MESSNSKSYSVGFKVFVVAASFSLPIAVLVWLMVDSINSNITIAQLEQVGNAYLRPLQDMLQRVQDLQEAKENCAGDQADCKSRVDSAVARGDQAVAALSTADARYGRDLKFTPEELAKRNRQSGNAGNIAQRWANLKAVSSGTVPAKDFEAMEADLRTMITHAGDTSTLILDPDLDSYYLMDATLIALPATEDRMSQMAAQATQFFAASQPSQQDFVQMAVSAAELKEDYEHTTASIQTALHEDENFYGVSPTLAARLTPALEQYRKTSERLRHLTGQLSESKSSVSPAEYAAAASEARGTAFAFWRIAVDELDKLLQARIGHYQNSRLQALGLSGLALLLASFVAFGVARTITGPLDSLMRSLAPGATLLGECVNRISAVTQTQTVDPIEASVIVGELDAHCQDMRRAVLELARHVSGSGGEREFAMPVSVSAGQEAR